MLCLIFLISHVAVAGSYGDYYKHCVLNKKGTFDYSVEQVDSIMLDLYTPSSAFDTVTSNTVAGIIRGSTRLYDEARNVVSVITGQEFIKGKNIRDWTMSSIKEQIKKYRLNDFEKAALINCAVYMLVDYKGNMSTKLGSILEIYEKGQGICTEMVAISMDLASAVGLKTRSMVSEEEHNWPEYKIGGTWYILDPTSGSSSFYESLKR